MYLIFTGSDLDTHMWSFKVTWEHVVSDGYSTIEETTQGHSSSR